MVTSAIGGEGKTTLTSHLAVCCAKAGISTLVIDADLRRASLSRTFQEEKNLGLSDVLKGDISLEEGLSTLHDGGFHLLPAGTPGQHPGWLFREQRVGQILERYRQMFDLVIIDTPPVLPVPDALSLGRWVDGAVLVLRYDVSRFPLVDRARRRLISAGIPILKTVVNGVRNSRLSFGYNGGYGYGYGYKDGYAERTPRRCRPIPCPMATMRRGWPATRPGHLRSERTPRPGFRRRLPSCTGARPKPPEYCQCLQLIVGGVEFCSGSQHNTGYSGQARAGFRPR